MDFDPLPAQILLDVATGSAFSAGQIIALAIALLCLIISGFVSGSEIAYFSLSPSDCEELDETPQGAGIRKFIEHPQRLLATILISNNLVNVTIVVLTNFALGPVFAGMPEWLSFVLQTVILTFLILLFGEILPKLYANNYTLQWAKMAAGGIGAMVKTFSPLSSMLVKRGVSDMS